MRGAAAVQWREHVSYVVQDPYLFRDTIRRNLLWASPQASEAELWQALAVAGADELVSRMASGLDTLVGERGTLISGGERQRLCWPALSCDGLGCSCSTKRPAPLTCRVNAKSSRRSLALSRAPPS